MAYFRFRLQRIFPKKRAAARYFRPRTHVVAERFLANACPFFGSCEIVKAFIAIITWTFDKALEGFSSIISTHLRRHGFLAYEILSEASRLPQETKPHH